MLSSAPHRLRLFCIILFHIMCVDMSCVTFPPALSTSLSSQSPWNSPSRGWTTTGPLPWCLSLWDPSRLTLNHLKDIKGRPAGPPEVCPRGKLVGGWCSGIHLISNTLTPQGHMHGSLLCTSAQRLTQKSWKTNSPIWLVLLPTSLWIYNSLTNRRQQVRLGSIVSTSTPHWHPQGCVLSPLLFSPLK